MAGPVACGRGWLGLGLWPSTSTPLFLLLFWGGDLNDSASAIFTHILPFN